MINPDHLVNFFKKKNIYFFSGVPDSVLKNFSNALKSIKSHYICANEGSAVSMAIGYHLATGNIGAVYMQNSGLSNAINPLISIAEKTVYSIPLLLIIGWRGSPGTSDEPQHLAKGKITTKLLSNLNIKYIIINSEKNFNNISSLINFSKKNNTPVAILFKKNVLLSSIKKINKKNYKKFITRKETILELLNSINSKDKIISTTGFTSRELFQLRKNYKIEKGVDFYMVGGMGHSSMVALGVSLQSNNNIICLDGDGALLMHMGSLALAGISGKKNFKYILLNNSSHESVGGQRTIADKIKFNLLARSLCFKSYFLIKSKKNYKIIINKFLRSKGPSFLEAKIRIGSIEELERPKNLLIIKKKFMKK